MKLICACSVLQCRSTYKMAASIRTKQTESLKRMINLNDTPRKTASSEPVWKVLVYDRYGQDIISPLLTVAELRELGVTLHLLLHSDRDSIPDVPAIYFVLPTEENIKRICQDCRNQCYESYYLNFITAIMRRQLEDLATAVLQGDCVTQISKVFDQYLNFISLEENMFTTRYQERDSISYYALNRPDAKDTDIENIRDTLVDSLFSFLVTLGTVPVIRCPRGNAAEIVSEALDKKLRENLRDARNSLFAGDMSTGQFSFQRPVLIILDRNIDLCTPLHHTWTYQALCHDVLDLHLNRVVIKESAPDNGPTEHGHSRPRPVKTKSYDLSATDNFWNNHRGSPFPNVAESIQKELDEYKASEGEVKRLKSIMGLDDSDEGAISDLMSDHTSKLTSAVSSLPELLEKKRLIDQHTNIATALLDQIKHRHLDTYFESEEKIMSNQRLDKSVLEFIQDPEAGTPEDKLRLFMIFYISGPTMSAAEFDQYSSALQDAGADLSALNYIKKWKAFTKITTGPVQSGGGGQNTYSAMFSKIIGTSSQFVMEGVKNLVVGNKNLPVTRIVDAIMEIKSTAPDVEDYRYFDPKMLRATDSSSIPRNKTPFQEAIVFVVGGGNYIEYQNLVDYAMRNPSNPKTIVYGASEIFNASQFVKQLEVLGCDPRS